MGVRIKFKQIIIAKFAIYKFLKKKKKYYEKFKK